MSSNPRTFFSVCSATVETCHVCGKEFRSHAYFQVHMRIHNTYTCDICGKVILGYNIMRSHKRKEHPDPNKARP